MIIGTLVFIALTLFTIALYLRSICEKLRILSIRQEMVEDELASILTKHVTYLKQITEILDSAKKPAEVTYNVSEKAPPANRKPRTEEQKKEASERRKRWWEEKRRQQEASAEQSTQQAVLEIV